MARQSQVRTSALVDALKPARPLDGSEIHDNIAEGEDGLLWGAFDIPIYFNEPLDQSNRETIDSEMSDHYSAGNAIRDGNVLLVRAFDPTGPNGRDIEYDDPAELPKSEAYEKMAEIAGRLEEYEVLNQEDFSEKEDIHVTNELASQARIVAWQGHIPENWPERLRSWLSENGCDYDDVDKKYKASDIIRGMRELGFLNPEAMEEFMLPDEVERMRQVARDIKDAETRFVAYLQARPEILRSPKIHELEEAHVRGVERLNALYERLVRGQTDDPSSRASSPDQFEMDKMLEKIDPSAVGRNEDILRSMEKEKERYITELKDILDRSSSEMAEEMLDEGKQEEFVFASVGREKTIGR